MNKGEGLASLVNIANFLSFSRIVITPLFIWMLFQGQGCIVFAVVLFTIAALTDTCDGYLARRYRLVTELGNFLDPLADKILIFSTFFCFYLLNFVPLWFVILLITRDVMITLLRAFMTQKNLPLQTSHLGKWKTTLQIILIYLVFLSMLAPTGLSQFQSLYHMLMAVFMYLVAGLTVYAGLDYLVKVGRAWR